MANVFQVSVYQINQQVLARDAPIKMAFPTTGVVFTDVSGSPTRSLSSGYNVYGLITLTGSAGQSLSGANNLYYVAETLAQLVTLAG